MAAAMFFTTVIYLVLPLVMLPLIAMTQPAPERPLLGSAVLLAGMMLMFAAFAALALAVTYLAIRMLAALATGAKGPISILLLLVVTATLLLGLFDVQQATGASGSLWWVGLGALLLHAAIGVGLVIGPIELRRATPGDRVVLAEPRAGTGIRAEIARLLHLPDTRAFSHRFRKRVWALAMVSLLFEGAAFYALLGWSEQLTKTAQRSLPASATSNPIFVAVVVAAVAAGVVASFGVCRLLVGIARRCRIKARRLTLEKAEDVVADDSRAPVLFLRSFAEDQVPLSAARVPWFLRGLDPGSEHGSLEEMLVLNLTYVGPVVAVGDPSQQRAPVGASRWRLSDDEWQRFVEEQIRRAGLIVIGLGESAGVRWEVDATRRITGAIDKTIFVCPPQLSRNPRVVTLIAEALGCSPGFAAPLANNACVLVAARDASATPTFFTAATLSEMAYYVAVRACLFRMRQATGIATERPPTDEERQGDRATIA